MLDKPEKRRSREQYQFERLGYFCVDMDTVAGKPVSIGVATADSWAKITEAKTIEKRPSASLCFGSRCSRTLTVRSASRSSRALHISNFE